MGARLLPWDVYAARWTARAIWPRMLLGSVVEESRGANILPPTSMHHIVHFGGDVLVEVRRKGTAVWRTLQLSRGDVVLRPAGLTSQQHRWSASGPFELVHAMFDPNEAPLVKELLPPGAIFKLDDPLLALLLPALQRAAKERLAGDDPYVDAATRLVCLQLGRSLAGASPPTGPGALPARTLRQICDHIEAHLSERLRLDALATLAGLSDSHFLRAFKASTGTTPARFVRKRRVLRAIQLLRSSKKSLVEIALETGFGSQSRFTIAFRADLGVAPGQFRRAQEGA